MTSGPGPVLPVGTPRRRSARRAGTGASVTRSTGSAPRRPCPKDAIQRRPSALVVPEPFLHDPALVVTPVRHDLYRTSGVVQEGVHHMTQSQHGDTAPLMASHDQEIRVPARLDECGRG